MIAFAYYLLKVMICSGVLFLYYHIALRNKLFHQWNRFYLLISVFVSLIAPVVQVSIMHQTSDESNQAIKMLQVFESADGYLEEVTIRSHQGISSEQWLMIAYIIVSAILFFSVLLALRKIFSIIHSHTIQWIEKIKFINTNIQGTPFSFFNFIFWNEEISIQSETGQQIFQHELVHVKEKHTIDKMFVQLLLVVFWCNPFFWLIKRELKLIHEFIADKKAVGEHGAAALAAMIISATYSSHFNSLTNQFFQTSIKRRLAMLSKIQNPKVNYLTRILALPILLITVLAFTLRTKNVNVPTAKLEKQITVVIDAGHGMMNDGKPNGASVGNISEDAIVLAIANKIKELNNDEKLKIVLTRTSDQNIDLHKRVDIAKENHADLFVSLHVNAYDKNADPGLTSNQELKSGFGVYVSNKQPSYQQQSETLGSILQQELNSIYPTNPFLLKRKIGVWVLDQNVCPSVLIECGFLSDEKDRAFITKENNQTAVAEKILEAIERYASNQQSFQKNIIDTVPPTQITNPSQDLINQNGNGLILKSGIRVEPLYILDGKEIDKAELDKINPNNIESINVLKQKSAINKYSVKGRNGVVEIHLKSNQPLYIVDGIQSSKEEVEKIDANTIESVNVLKDKSAIDKYGTKGLNGVIEINLNPNKKSDGISIQKNGEPFTTVSGKDTIPYKEPLFTKVEIEASVNKEEWEKHLQKSLRSYIEQAAEKKIEPGTYTVNVKFIVKKDGSVSDVKVLNDPGFGLADAAVKTVRTGPKWYPGIQNGKPVNSYHTQPIHFVIQKQ